jgi:CelD/BcsL family acetyltransferase involved in cellulose biosynthesis
LNERYLIPVGHSDYDYHDPLVHGELRLEEWRSYWNQLSELLGSSRSFRVDRFQLDGLRADRFPELQNLLVQDEPCPFIQLDGLSSGEDLLVRLQDKVRKKFLRDLNRISKAGEVTTRFFGSQNIADALAHLPLLLNYHARRWPKAYRAPGFHQRLLQEGLKAGTIELAVLILDQEPIAWQIYILDSAAIRYYMPVHIAEWKHLRPGHILRYSAIKLAISRQIPRYDFLRGAESYKADWATAEQWTQHFTIAPTRRFAGIRTSALTRLEVLLASNRHTWNPRVSESSSTLSTR